MDQIDILDENGKQTGAVKSMADVHRDGDWHRTVHVWFLNPQGELLLQLRSKESYLAPNQWDISVGGHVVAGQRSVYSAVKETNEELGITLAPEALQYLGTLQEDYTFYNEKYKETIIHKDFCDVYLVQTELRSEDMRFTDGEVQEVRWVPWQTLERWVREGKPDLVPHPEEYGLLFEKINLHVS